MLRRRLLGCVGAALGAGVGMWDCVSLDRYGSVDSSFLRSLERIVGEEHVSVDVDEREAHGKDAYSFHSGPAPEAVVFPASTAEVSSIMALASSHRVPVIPYGGGTSLEGHTLCPHGGITLDLSRMDKVLHVSEEDADCTAQAGVTWEHLNEYLKEHNSKHFFAVDPGPGATLGGMVATGCSGTNAVRYGTMGANVLSLEVVLADGRVMRTGTRARKSSAGYDLTGLLVGSEGTLGVVTEVTVRLRPLPEREVVGVAPFMSIDDAAKTVIELLQHNTPVHSLEILNAPMIDAINAKSNFSFPSTPHLFLKFSGSEGGVKEAASAARRIVEAHGCDRLQLTRDEKEMQRLWSARKVALWSAEASQPPEAKTIITDVCVPISQLATAVTRTQQDIDNSPLAGRAYIVGHAGDGNFHTFLSYHNEAEKKVAKAITHKMALRAIALGGTITGEHGIGVGKIDLLRTQSGEHALHSMQAIKAALDPHHILNPGKVFKQPNKT